MRSLVIIAVLVSVRAIAAPAQVPVQDDIVDIRHGRMPDRRVFLGWTADDRAVQHVIQCAQQNYNDICVAMLVVSHDAKGADGDTVSLFTAEEPPSITTDVASAAIAAERSALAKLGPLTPSAGDAIEKPTVVKVKDGIVLRRGGKTVARIDDMPDCSDGWCDHFTKSLGNPKIRSVQLSPDRKRISVATDYDSFNPNDHHLMSFVVIDN